MPLSWFVIFPALSLLLLAVGLWRLAPRKPGYRHGVHTISELGEVGAPDAARVAWALFLPVGLLLLPLVAAYRALAPAVAALAACVATGYVVAALFPCDPGSPASGTPRQAVHNLGGAVEYLGGALCLFWASEDFGIAYRALGFVVAAVAIGLTVLPQRSVRGALQRVGELALFGALVALAWQAAQG